MGRPSETRTTGSALDIATHRRVALLEQRQTDVREQQREDDDEAFTTEKSSPSNPHWVSLRFPVIPANPAPAGGEIPDGPIEAQGALGRQADDK